MTKKPLVGIIMGSDSDLSVMQEAAKVLEEFGVPYEMTLLSAHRSPARAAEYAGTAVARGLKIIIGGAGVAAHLAGAIAAQTTLPVIGVPIESGALKGVDALFATVQMPPGIPVATVAINGAKNAGLLAVQILATADKKLQAKFVEYKKGLEKTLVAKAEKLEKIGFEKYLKESK
ncbi:MAG: 5-(carboxyamino)imidazole ribonucleotide mutase [Candidatus Liptonbacteria bacterium]|nr:5-(carboxyamino)imidazole ribonucleotide mutase [Candidatus Liptonbacteria bacterium]